MTQSDKQPDPAPGDELPMPGAVGSAGSPLASPEPIVIPQPPSAGKQVIQLVLIPAAIVICAVSIAILFAKLAGSTENIDTQLMKLRESSGEGRMALNLQDPRYKNRSMAAYNIATMIPAIKDPAERKRISNELVDILDHNLSADSDTDDKLYVYVLSAVGQLGQKEGLEAIVKRLTMSGSRPMVKQGAIRGLLSWPRDEEAKQHAKSLLPLLADQDLNVSSMAAAALGQLGDGKDAATIAALKDAMTAAAEKSRDLRWNAASSLARLGDPEGSKFVAEVLLNRTALAKMEVDGAGSTPQIPAGTTLPTNLQDQVILSALAASVTMNDPVVWAQIEKLRTDDPSLPVRTAASMVTDRHKRGSATLVSPAPPVP